MKELEFEELIDLGGKEVSLKKCNFSLYKYFQKLTSYFILVEMKTKETALKSNCEKYNVK